MKTFSVIFENVKKGMAATAKNRKSFKAEYHSLSRLLRDAQLKQFRKYTDSIFAGLGFVANGKIKAEDVLKRVPAELFVTDEKNGEKYPCYISKVVKTKVITVEGVNVRIPDLNAKGEKQYTYKLTPVKEGQWNIDKLQAILEAANECGK